MGLSEFTLRNAKPRDKAYKLADSGGLYVAVQPSGSKLWRLKYRFAGRESLLSFGPYPLVGLAEARRKRDAAKRLLLDGANPAEDRRRQKIEAEAAANSTFGLLAQEYLDRMKASDAAEATLTKATWLLNDLAAPLARRPLQEVTAAEILRLLQKIEVSGRRETARRLRGIIGTVFRYGIVTQRTTVDPTLALHGALLAPKVVGRAAIVDERKLGVLVADIEDYDGWPTISAALKFLLLTCVRPGEVRHAVRSEFDLKGKVWRIPAERMKMRVPHEVPLSWQALAVLEDVWQLSEDGELVFPSIRSKDRPLSEAAFNSALRRMGYGAKEVTAHGFRVSASTILNTRGYEADVVEAALAHQDQNSVRRAYNRSTYWKQRVRLMQDWADLLEQFRGIAWAPSRSTSQGNTAPR